MTQSNFNAFKDVISNYFIPETEEDLKAFSSFVRYDDQEKEVSFLVDNFTVAVLSDENYKEYPAGFDFFKDITFKTSIDKDSDFDIVISKSSFRKILMQAAKTCRCMHDKKIDKKAETDLDKFIRYMTMTRKELAEKHEEVSNMLAANETDLNLIDFSIKVKRQFGIDNNFLQSEPVEIASASFLRMMHRLP